MPACALDETSVGLRCEYSSELAFVKLRADDCNRSKLIPTLFMHYNLELSDPKAEWTTKCHWFVMQQGVNVRLTRRRS